MKLLTALILLSGLVLGVIALRTPAPDPIEAKEVPRSLAHEPAEGHIVQAFQVEGMCCTTCPGALRKAVAKLEGVADIAADPATGRVEIETTPAIDPQTLAAAMTFDKYVAQPID